MQRIITSESALPTRMSNACAVEAEVGARGGDLLRAEHAAEAERDEA